MQILERSKLLKFIDIFAGGNWTILKAEDERLFVCGLNNFGQLGKSPSNQQEANGEENGSQQMEVADEGNYIILRPEHISEFDLTDSKWTHISGVMHLVFRNDKGLNLAIIFDLLIFFRRSLCYWQEH